MKTATKDELKVLVVGADWHGEWAKDTVLAFRSAGIEADVLYTNTLFSRGHSDIKSRTKIEGVKKYFRHNARWFFEGVKVARRRLSERALLKKFSSVFEGQSKTALILFIWTPPSERLLKRLNKKKNLILFLWQGEAPPRNLSWTASFPYFEHIFSVDEEWLPLFGQELQERISFLPLASNPLKHFPLDNKSNDIRLISEIAFVGVYHEARAKILACIREYDVKIYGYGWEAGFEKFPWLKEKYHGPLSNEDANKVFNSTKIAIGGLLTPIAYGNTVTQRVFDVALAKNFQLSSYTPAVSKFFGDTVIMFRDGEDLKRLVDYYLKHPEERISLAGKAHAIALANHTYVNRVNEIVSVVERLTLKN